MANYILKNSDNSVILSYALDHFEFGSHLGSNPAGHHIILNNGDKILVYYEAPRNSINTLLEAESTNQLNKLLEISPGLNTTEIPPQIYSKITTSTDKIINITNQEFDQLLSLLIAKVNTISSSVSSSSSNGPTTGKFPIQKIYYGAPGTGKSTEVSDEIKKYHGLEFPTTFHPEYDYSTFIGSYKPVVKYHENVSDKFNENDLASELVKECNSNVSDKESIHYFGFKYADYFNGRLKNFLIADILTRTGLTFPSGTDLLIQQAINLRKAMTNDGYIEDNGIISYEFTPQVFTDAYVRAWKEYEKNTENPAQVFLDIEEINRGNCAQIFGDIFQLLDRDQYGFSKNTVKPFKELLEYLKEKLPATSGGVSNDEIKLPPNFNIFATMNTSDQSLFPMDSAFKRRFQMEYVPINYSHTAISNFTIEISGTKYKWASFIKNVNEKIYNLTHSEDKMIGEFFILNGSDVEVFKNKVMFFIWSDICKEYKTDRADYFLRSISKPDDEPTSFIFSDLFDPQKNDKDQLLKGFMDYLDVLDENGNDFKKRYSASVQNP
jgi:hypothetical protein